MKAYLTLKIDLGEVQEHLQDQLTSYVGEVLKHMPLESLDRLSFEIDGQKLPVKVEVVMEKDPEVKMSDELQIVVGDDAMMGRSQDNLKAVYTDEEALKKDLEIFSESQSVQST